MQPATQTTIVDRMWGYDRYIGLGSQQHLLVCVSLMYDLLTA
jgi:hypothetical protein